MKFTALKTCTSHGLHFLRGDIIEFEDPRFIEEFESNPNFRVIQDDAEVHPWWVRQLNRIFSHSVHL